MSLSKSDLAQILAHCRDLLDASTQLNVLAVGRHESAWQARRRWEGELEITFGLRMQDEADDLPARSRELLDDADAWARVWADTVNELNRQRRAEAVEQRRNERGSGSNRRYYEWDHLHNEIEVFDSNNVHLGAMEPVTGEMIKPPVVGRTPSGF